MTQALAPPVGPMSVAAGRFSVDYLTSWCLSRVDDGAKELGLCHFVEGGGGNEFLLLKAIREKGAKQKEEVAKIAEEFCSTVYEHVATHRTPQRYGFVAFDDKKQPRGQHQFMLAPPPSSAIGGESEPANQVGALAMSLRHQEAMARTYITGHAAMFDRMERMMERSFERQSQLEDKHADTLKYQQELIDRQFERQLALEERKFEQEITQRLFRQLEVVLPAVLAKSGLVPPEQLQAAAEGKLGTIPELFDGLPEEQQKAIFAALPEDVRKEFAELLDRKAAPPNFIRLFQRLDDATQKEIERIMGEEQSNKLAAIVRAEFGKMAESTEPQLGA